MNKEQISELGRQLAPIELPPEPSWTLVYGIAGALAVILLGYLIMRWWQHRAKGNHNSLSELTAIQRGWQAGDFDDRRCAYQLATLLRHKLRLNQLSNTAPVPLSAQRETWATTITLLDELRYRDNSQVKLSETEFSHIQQWLKTPC